VDLIRIEGLRLMTVVGVLPHEREAAQPLQVDLALHVDLHDAGVSDELDDTANYGAVAEAVASTVTAAEDMLLERLAGRIATVALSFRHVGAVDVRLTKLRPPIPIDVAATAVEIHRTRKLLEVPDDHLAYVALGSNLGDRVGLLRHAVEQLSPDAVSQVYETAAVGGPDNQGPFLNMVVELRTPLDPFALIRRLQRLEEEAGRTRVVHWGPRTLDCDLILFDDAQISTDALTVPHPRFHERRFVLEPLAELAPHLCPPDWDSTLPPGGITCVGPLTRLAVVQ
jgi:dihydroneopterin aldolase/2-amino-4-hydroxy-6-hydroxymethyldihydropteridine diphosphokinase